MKLISAQVAGFGRLENTEYDFRDGLNTVFEENGQGKTTLMVFLKAMFFGMEYSPRKKELLERAHYLPWHTNSYGGSLVFETGEGENTKRYRIERTFGKSDKDDTLTIYDDTTNFVTDDFGDIAGNGSSLGEAIFGIDRDSFEKSVYIPQEALETQMTDSMNAKMGNLHAVQDDINNFDRAEKQIEELYKSYTRNSKTNPGKLTKIRADIREKKERIEELPALNDAYEKQDEILGERFTRLYEQTKRKDELSEAIAVQSKKEKEFGAYLEQKKRLQENLGKYQVLQNIFTNGAPDKQFVEEKIEEERRLQIDVGTLEEKKSVLPDASEIGRLRILFSNEDDPPCEERLAEFSEMADRLKELRIQSEHAKMSEDDAYTLQELKFYFAKKDPTAEELTGLQEETVRLAVLQGQRKDLTDAENSVRQEREELLAKRKERGADGSLWLVIVLTAILFGGAVAFYVFTGGTLRYILAGICVFAALVVLTVGLIVISRRKKAMRLLLEETDGRIAEYAARISDLTAQEEEIEKTVMGFLSNFLVSPTDTTQQMLAEIQRKSGLYHRLLEEEANLIETSSETLEELTELQLRLYTALEPYAKVYGTDLYHEASEEQVIRRLKEDRETYLLYLQNAEELSALEARIQSAKEDLTEFLMQFVFADAGDENPSLLNRLNTVLRSLEQMRTLTEEIETLEQGIVAFEDAHDVDEETEPVEELQKRQKNIEDEIAELNRFIEKEKENLSELSENISNLEDLRSEILSLEETESTYERRAMLLEKTLEYLRTAREQFLSRYMAPLQSGLRKYLSRIYENTDGEIDAKKFSLDMNLAVCYSDGAQTFDGAYLSAGYQDLAAFCLRIALVDVLYQKEQPMLFLDDPFTNLDADKVRLATRLVSDLALSRQILYFTCHESRMP